FLAGLGTVSAGMLPDVVQHWEVFQRVTEIFILVMSVVGVIIGSKRIGINPDNVATPIAASFGDLITLACLSQGLYECIVCLLLSVSTKYYPYVSYLVCLIFLCLTHLWVAVSFRNPASCILLYTGWEPIITAMVISRSATLFRAPEVVFTLLCLADWMVHCLWRTGKDPDSYSIPYLYWARPSSLWPSSCSGS
ncbi:solute carrier family 41 member 2-like, partial [Salvelinus alpinus]